MKKIVELIHNVYAMFHFLLIILIFFETFSFYLFFQILHFFSQILTNMVGGGCLVHMVILRSWWHHTVCAFSFISQNWKELSPMKDVVVSSFHMMTNGLSSRLESFGTFTTCPPTHPKEQKEPCLCLFWIMHPTT